MTASVRGAGSEMARRMASVRHGEGPVRLGVLLTGSVLAALLLVGCSSSDDSSEPSAASTVPSTTEDDAGSAANRRVEVPEEFAPLEDLLLDETLPGFRRADRELGAGPLTLEQAARLEADEEAERALLETRGFERGFSRAFVSDLGDVIYLQVYEFGDSSEAAFYLADGREAITARGGTEFEVPDLEGAVGITVVDESPEGAFVGHAVSFVVGPRHFLVVAGSPQDALDPADAVEVGRAQWNALDLADGEG
jgi:hypothetical protein